MEPTKDELAQLELRITDLERRISDTTSRVAFEPGAFGSLQVLHFMEQTLEGTVTLIRNWQAKWAWPQRFALRWSRGAKSA